MVTGEFAGDLTPKITTLQFFTKLIEIFKESCDLISFWFTYKIHQLTGF